MMVEWCSVANEAFNGDGLKLTKSLSYTFDPTREPEGYKLTDKTTIF